MDPLNSKEFWDAARAVRESFRVFDVCHGCRRCFNLCPSFGTLFTLIDNADGAIEKLGDSEVKAVVDLCYYCKLCYDHCPYTPPHRFDVDFPRLMLRNKAIMVKERG
ncbi:MAG: (Fe-S)-binding protein, partial [Nitrospirota bacterium]